MLLRGIRSLFFNEKEIVLMNVFTKTLDKVISVFDKICCVLGSVFFISFCACVLIQVFARTFLPFAPSWTEELARYTFIYMIAFGCAVAVHRNEFVTVEFLHDALEANHHIINEIIDLIVKIVLMIFCIFVLIKAVIPFAFLKFTMYSTALQMPMQYVYYGIVILFALMSVAYAMEVIAKIAHWKDGKEAQ